MCLFTNFEVDLIVIPHLELGGHLVLYQFVMNLLWPMGGLLMKAPSDPPIESMLVFKKDMFFKFQILPLASFLLEGNEAS